MAENFIDIGTPLDRKGIVHLDKWHLREIEKNPGKLTKEGVMMKIKYWALSSNVYNQAKYIYMLKSSPLAESGKTKEGEVILSRAIKKKGTTTVPVWWTVPIKRELRDSVTNEFIGYEGVDLQELKLEVTSYIEDWLEKHQVTLDRSI